MAKDPTPPKPVHEMPPAPPEGTYKDTPDWEKIVYSNERIQKWLHGEINLKALAGISGPEMIEMAVLGFKMYEQARYEDAATVFRGLINLDGRQPYYHSALGATLLALEDLDRAEMCFNVAIGLNKNELAAYVNRGEVYLRKGKLLEAAQDFKTAIDLDPQRKDPLSVRARMLALATLNALREAQSKRAAGGGAEKAQAPAKTTAKKASSKGSKKK